MTIKTYTYIVWQDYEGETMESRIKATGLFDALFKAKRLMSNVTHVIPNRQNTLSKPERYTVERIEEQIKNVPV